MQNTTALPHLVSTQRSQLLSSLLLILSSNLARSDSKDFLRSRGSWPIPCSDKEVGTVQIGQARVPVCVCVCVCVCV